MTKHLSLLTALLIANSPIMAQEVSDPRQLVEMPPEMRQMFLTNMRGHMEALDNIIAALAVEDLSKAADIAEDKMGVGHGKKRQCDDTNINEKTHEHSHSDHKEKKGHKGKKGFGQFMPAEMKIMGMSLHTAANEFASVSRQGNVGDAYKALRQISASCVACHKAFQVK